LRCYTFAFGFVYLHSHTFTLCIPQLFRLLFYITVDRLRTLGAGYVGRCSTRRKYASGETAVCLARKFTPLAGYLPHYTRCATRCRVLRFGSRRFCTVLLPGLGYRFTRLDSRHQAFCELSRLKQLTFVPLPARDSLFLYPAFWQVRHTVLHFTLHTLAAVFSRGRATW